MSRLISWFSTSRGRIFTRSCVGLAAAAAFTNHLALNGFLLDRVKTVVQAYKQGQPRPLPTKMNELVENVLQDCPLSEEEKRKLDFFYVCGHDLFHAGGKNSPWGAIIGIPFTFENIENINFGELKMAGTETVDWVIDGQDLIKSLSISDNAKKFALMREIYTCDFSHVLENATINGGCILIIARFIQVMNAKLRALERFSFMKRSFQYVIFYMLGFVLYRCLKDPLKHIADMKADKLAAEISTDYLNGGIEYYKKILLKQKALRDIPGSHFKSAFDENGNENYIILAPKLPISKRLEKLREIRKQKVTDN